MKIRAGYELIYDCPLPVDMLMMVNVHRSREADLLTPQNIRFSGAATSRTYDDRYGNVCTLVRAPAGRLVGSADFTIEDSALPDEVNPYAEQPEVAALPEYVLTFLLASRYCETDRLSDTAWALFGHISPGWGRVQAILDYVN